MGSLTMSKYVGMSNLTGSTGSKKGHALGCFLRCWMIFMHGFISALMAYSNT